MSIEQKGAPSNATRSGGRATVAGRITVGLIPKALDELHSLVEATRLSLTDVVNRAISIYFLVVSNQNDGYELVFRHKETGRERIVEII